MKVETKFKVGRYLLPAVLDYQDGRIFVSFRYSKALIAEIKSMEGAKWHGYDKTIPRKIWSITDCPRNHFQLEYLQGNNPYAKFDTEIKKHTFDRPLLEHQKEFVDFILARKQCIIAGEMGVGKTLAAIEVMERIGGYWWYVAPKSALRAVERELMIWEVKMRPHMVTYEGLVEWVKERVGQDITDFPQGVVFDESARIKNPTTQRSQAAMIFANLIRENDGYIVLMSGAPAPRSPDDWWNQAEVACPGFLKEGNKSKFKRRLGIIVQKEFYGTGKTYPSLESWLDDEKKCAVCGLLEEEHNSIDLDSNHDFKPSKNEVSYLYDRMEGLALVRLKSECTDLPDIHYTQIVLEPSQKIINIARTIVETAKTTISGITLLRELSDGFQYHKEAIGDETCPVCLGKKELPDPLNVGKLSHCDGCGGKGTRKKYARTVTQIETPKEGALRDLLDEYVEVGRVVIFGGFTGTVDRCVQICQDNGWETIRVDGRGWEHNFQDPLETFQNQQEEHPFVAFIAQAGAGGFGLTLTASPVIIYYSNSFNFEDRIQSEARIHRVGMDVNRGATIIDLIHLATDELILENLKKKRQLQSLSMGELQRALG